MVEEKLKQLGITLPEAPQPIASYVPAKVIGNMVYISGQGPIINGIQMYTGKVGKECTKEEGYQAARLCGLNLIAQLKKVIGDLDRVKEIVHLKGFIASTTDFFEQPTVINGASDLMIEIFGEAGKHTRCALGTNVLPTDIPVEIELVVEIKG
ncbi:Enamine deaminase RidA, house cleaning of reactive enamine intermediates, YjgF/YER057c/UK114 family [Anaerovirgula multivorans]|uniref:Enamine deaminase RidA, house cleaning of reactive enamine intermediates, YjgF/YER057c/UK114 family n=1 Tax=Anaerovirgula multivorans TaxID=312168 RepID=A0A239ICP5_9FIRM|nr:RidA family protein [Anaerovirgula multivorans]SNS91038.1 Enamine deaminase RidA, house cleaning of reactive enamine intermediates, YjgF/YER057c/UK114 family [Anaerovirgula multivorans]